MKTRIWVLAMVLALFLALPLTAMARQYIIPDSDTRQLTEEELWEWDYESLGYILNEIFARHGYVFNEGGEYEAYFSQLSWYTPNASDDNETMVYEYLSTVEWYNESLIKDIRSQMREAEDYNSGGKNYLDYITFNVSYEVEIDFTYQSFEENQKFDVYSAPSTSSYRGASGKASVSTNGSMYVAGWDNGWLLIMYDTNSGAVRVGYIRYSESNYAIDTSDLEFAYTTVTCSRTCYLTDDPVTGSTSIVRLSSGDDVTYLATYDIGSGWAYVETTVSGQTVRGFIPMSVVQ